VNRNRKHLDVVALNTTVPSLPEFLSIIYTFTLTCIAWVFFRSNSIAHAFYFIKKIFFELLAFSSYKITLGYLRYQIGFITITYIMIFIIIEWKGRRGKFALSQLDNFKSGIFRYTFYLFLIFSIIFFSGNDQQFIYFQF
jgi:hypothetical protein